MYLLPCLLLLFYNYVEANFTSKWQRGSQTSPYTFDQLFVRKAVHLRKVKWAGVTRLRPNVLHRLDVSEDDSIYLQKYGVIASLDVVFFPSAHRVRRSSPEFLDPVLQQSVPEVELLYEFLSTGVQIDSDSKLTLLDPELSSLRKATTFDVVCNDVIPKAISDIRRLGDQLSKIPGPLKREDFERTVLTMAYTALKTPKSDNKNQRRVWMESLTKLFLALRRDLMFLYNKDDQQ